MSKNRYKRNESVVLRDVAGEKLLIPVKGRLADLQNIFVLEGLGEWVWEQLDGARELEEISAAVAVRFDRPDEEVTKDCHDFIASLVQEGLVSSV